MSDPILPSTPTPPESSSVVRLQYRLLDVSGNVIVLAPDLDADLGDVRAEGGLRLVGNHRAEAFQAFATALRQAGGPYAGATVLVTGSLSIVPVQAAAPESEQLDAQVTNAAPSTADSEAGQTPAGDAEDGGEHDQAPGAPIQEPPLEQAPLTEPNDDHNTPA